MITCNCADHNGTGLPCIGMSSVARSTGAVLSYKLFHRHWYGMKVTQLPKVDAVFTENAKFDLNVDAVIQRPPDVQPPAKLDGGIAGPTSVTVVKRIDVDERKKTADHLETILNAPSGSTRARSAVASITGDTPAVPVQLIEVQHGNTRSDSKKSRRIKTRQSKK